MNLNSSHHLLIAVGLCVLSGVAHFAQPENQLWVWVFVMFIGVVARGLGADITVSPMMGKGSPINTQVVVQQPQATQEEKPNQAASEK